MAKAESTSHSVPVARPTIGLLATELPVQDGGPCEAAATRDSPGQRETASNGRQPGPTAPDLMALIPAGGGRNFAGLRPPAVRSATVRTDWAPHSRATANSAAIRVARKGMARPVEGLPLLRAVSPGQPSSLKGRPNGLAVAPRDPRPLSCALTPGGAGKAPRETPSRPPRDGSPKQPRTPPTGASCSLR